MMIMNRFVIKHKIMGGKSMKSIFFRLSVGIGLAALASAVGVQSTFAGSVTFGFEPGMTTNVVMQDNTLLEAAPNLNRGAFGSLQWSDAPGDERRVIWQISNDFTNHIPAGESIISATLKFVNLVSQSATTGSVYRMLKPWAETTTTWNNQDTTGPTAWASPGLGIGTDVASSPFISNQAFPAVSPLSIHAFNITSELQFWRGNPSSNYGIAFIAALNSPEVSWGDVNRADASGTEKPRLEVVYTPEPSAGLLGGVGLVMLLRRRRPRA